jgi:hypothetical protein
MGIGNNILNSNNNHNQNNIQTTSKDDLKLVIFNKNSKPIKKNNNGLSNEGEQLLKKLDLNISNNSMEENGAGDFSESYNPDRNGQLIINNLLQQGSGESLNIRLAVDDYVSVKNLNFLDIWMDLELVSIFSLNLRM